MIDALRIFLHRPLADRDRTRLFAVAVAVIAAAATGFALLDRPTPPRPAAARHPSVADPPAPAGTPAPVATPAPHERAPSEEGRAPATAASHAQVDSAKRAARRFLAGYLPYSYGRRRARAIPATSGPLRRRLAEHRPRVPAAERHRRPHVLLLQANGAGRRRTAMVALVGDGARTYTVPLELERARSGWRVTRVGS